MLDPDQVARRLARHASRQIPLAGLRPAAVLLPWLRGGGEDRILVTRRTEHLEHHRGEIAFPGGRRESGDADLLATALRETEEELGIAPREVRVLGRLDDIVSVYGYHVVPFVGLLRRPRSYRLDPREIAEAIEVPLGRLLDPAVFRVEDWSWRGRSEPVCFFSVEEAEIWGLTAAILRQFLERVGLLTPLQGQVPCNPGPGS